MTKQEDKETMDMDEPVEGTKIQRDLLDFFAIGKDMAFHLDRMEQGLFATPDEHVYVQRRIHDLQHILANFDADVALSLVQQALGKKEREGKDMSHYDRARAH